MVINPIKDGIVLDHIKAGNAMELYNILNLGELECSVAIIKNADSVKMGKKDVLKIDQIIDIDFNVLAIVDPGITVNIIRDGKLIKRTHLELPSVVKNVLKCQNPRCITATEQELTHIFKLTDPENRVYRCIYCETKAKNYSGNN
ncbi:MAG TPA: aspartate carbamoyltransferase regulatory subunit [Clostridia bacterium]|jgi:aspartate carbamoyltransferase regulatory subunit|nr:aspartate carbamoyltransferase regulatory subunit [Clostridia bacterium]